MSVFRCPVCAQPLAFGEKEAVCPRNHHFDRARQGHVNLLQSQGSAAKRHGDDRLMVEARRRFLEKGFYAPLMEAAAAAAVEYAPPRRCTLLDTGCGEGYYTEGIYRALTAAGREPDVNAIDISRDAAKTIARRPFPLEAAVASAFALPVQDESCDLVVDIFAPCAEKEFALVLKPGGILLRAVPLPRHLFGLKAAIYDKPYLNAEPRQELPGFAPVELRRLCWELVLNDPQDIDDLFKMTPYYYKTSAADQEKVKKLPGLSTELAFGLLIDRRL